MHLSNFRKFIHYCKSKAFEAIGSLLNIAALCDAAHAIIMSWMLGCSDLTHWTIANNFFHTARAISELFLDLMPAIIVITVLGSHRFKEWSHSKYGGRVETLCTCYRPRRFTVCKISQISVIVKILGFCALPIPLTTRFPTLFKHHKHISHWLLLSPLKVNIWAANVTKFAIAANTLWKRVTQWQSIYYLSWGWIPDCLSLSSTKSFDYILDISNCINYYSL